MEKERVYFLDYLRVVACFMVMLVHASENFYGANSPGLASNMSFVANESNRFWVAFFDGFVSRAAVPLFMITSAYLLVPLKSGQSMVEFYKRRFKRILPPMICFFLLYTFLPLAWGGTTWEQSMADLRLLPWNFPSLAGHLWFMYPLISLYIIMPVVSPWLEKVSAKDERLFLYFFVATTFVPFIRRFVTPELWGECFWNGFNGIWYCSGFLGYLVLAHYTRVYIKWTRAKRVRVGLTCAVLGAAFTGWSFWFKGTPGTLIETPMIEWAWEFCTFNVLVQTFGIFLLFTAIPEHKVPALVTDISKKSFGMYLMHMFYLTAIATWVIGEGGAAQPQLPVWTAIPIIAVGSYVCCYVTTKVLSYLPGSKWVVG
ncbi:MAG: acyltransferase [Bacteroidaceae bacterium]|nr:acyltransferase [Bacteroidaceae bacterium]